MLHASVFAACVSLAVFALPGFGQDRPSLSGTWKFDASKSELHTSKMAGATWVIKEGDNAIHITESEDGSSKKIELQCTTDGKDCKVVGEKATASFWYNGPMLVEMETKGDHVVRYRIKISDDGKTLSVDTTYIVPAVTQADLMVFEKQA